MLHPSETSNKMTVSRQKRDQNDEESLLCLINKAITLHRGTPLQNAVTKDVARSAILDSLLNAKKHGHDKVTKFVKDRLCGDDTGTVHVKFNDPWKKSNAPTFHGLYKKCSSNKKKNTDNLWIKIVI